MLMFSEKLSYHFWRNLSVVLDNHNRCWVPLLSWINTLALTAKNTVFSPSPELCGNCSFPQNFHTRKLGEIAVFFAVTISFYHVLMGLFAFQIGSAQCLWFSRNFWSRYFRLTALDFDFKVISIISS